MSTLNVLSVSTIHVAQDYKSDMLDYIVADGEYQTLVYVPEEITNLTEYVMQLFQLAVDNGCAYVLLDGSGDEYAELERFDWEGWN
jgi:hypothetical protein